MLEALKPMKFPVLHYYTFIVIFFLTHAAAVTGLLVSFPPSFFVTTGTTIPFPSSTPVAQSGAIYVSNATRQLRIDNFFLGSQHSFVADGARRRGFLIESYHAGTGGAGGKKGFCKAFAMAGDVEHFGVPDEFVRDAERALVRGVGVTRYAGYDRDSSGPLQAVDYYVRKMSLRLPGAAADFVFTVPWRVQTRRLQQALKELTDAPVTVPSWRYFGGPFFDEVAVPEDPFATQLQRLMEDTVVTVDFYNFVPMPPDPAVFAVPDDCEEASAEAASSDLDISLAQRLLVDLSFYTKAGRQLLRDTLQHM